MDLTKTMEWRALERLAKTAPSLRRAFADDPERAHRYSIEAAGLFLDFSKNRIDDPVLAALIGLARARRLDAARAAMFAGEAINRTEKRAALHVALRDLSARAYLVAGRDVAPDVARVRAKMAAFCDQIHARARVGRNGATLDTVVNIGIGGSDLGPRMATQALKPCWIEGRRTHFVSNVDGQDLSDALCQVDPARTLFVVASKTFTTQETMTNAQSARAWFLASGATEADIARHFVAISTNEAAVRAFGVDPANMFEFWDWVGGRYSLWSAIGLSLALQIGWKNFEALLAGASAMDAHFETAPLERCMPALIALVGVWNRNFLGAGAHAVLPYDQHLSRLPAYLQQADMESNGKSVGADGAPLSWATGPVLFGEPGTNGQHAFHQLIHQGTDLISADFIAVACSASPLGDHHEKLLANLLAQAEALMRGRTLEEAVADLRAKGASDDEAERLAPHRVFTGDRPSNVLLMDRLTPRTLGALIALYEHKIFCQGVVWGINSFDQWGVELGKELASAILPEIAGVGARKPPAASHDASTNMLIDRINALRAMGGKS